MRGSLKEGSQLDMRDSRLFAGGSYVIDENRGCRCQQHHDRWQVPGELLAHKTLEANDRNLRRQPIENAQDDREQPQYTRHPEPRPGLAYCLSKGSNLYLGSFRCFAFVSDPNTIRGLAGIGG